MQLSNYLGATIQVQAGPLAIAAGDLVEISGTPPQLYPAKVTNYAGVNVALSTVVAAVTAKSGGIGATSNRKEAYQGPDGSIYTVGTNSVSTTGCTIARYSPAGKLLAWNDLVTSQICHAAGILPLSNGNLAIVWNSSSAQPWSYAIVDLNLKTIVARTTVEAIANNDAAFHGIALSGGGFAVSYGKAGGLYLAIYTNTGTVTLAPTLIASTPTANPCPKLAQLSNGNIAVVLSSTTGSQALGYAIHTSAGAASVAYTVLDTASAASLFPPDISVLTGFFAVTTNDGTNTVAYVLSNAGVVQGSAYSASNSVTTPNSSQMLNDGSVFWLVFFASGSLLNVISMPTTGTNYVTSSLSSASLQQMSCAIDRGTLAVVATTNLYVTTLLSTGATGPFTSSSSVLPTSNYMNAVIACGDGCIFMMAATGTDTLVNFGVQKIVATSIAGVAQQAVAAGNAGTLVSVSYGPGAYNINPLVGSAGVASVGYGVRGVLFPNSIVLNTVPRNIN